MDDSMKRHYVGTVDDNGFRTPEHYKPHSGGYTRLELVDHTIGESSVHMGLGLVGIQPGGHLKPVVHAFEKGFYVLDGTIIMQMDGRNVRLGACRE